MSSSTRIVVGQHLRRRGTVLPVLIREIRRSRGISQQMLADMTGLTPKTVWRLERGIHRPYPHTIEVISKALGVAFDDLGSLNSESDNRTLWLVVEDRLLSDDGRGQTEVA